MRDLMSTYDRLPYAKKQIARRMADAARKAMTESGAPPLNDDNAAHFDEACAVFLNARLLADGDPGAVLPGRSS